ncbi:hypothetical protein [Reichenbachiella ulvae]|uniref:Outer membrane protein beta-barrel domain-containing protein n=1 Tax=Reichenbachiella ulvae TaxID=2980104 RepID=A0ABT3CXV3_9BACT|nr:hypothetical protein [Reichenbachiella ulvae]MCV9388389.1 hypothetical protein [Reichenbachiella ulvae]
MTRGNLCAFVFLFSILLSFKVSAQDSFGISVEIGTVVGIQSSKDNTPEPGLLMSAGPRLGIFDNKFYLKPTGTIRLINSKVENTYPTHERILDLGIGTELLARFGEFNELQVYPLIGFKTGYNFFLLAGELQDDSDEGVMKSTGWSFDYIIGAYLEYQSFYFKPGVSFLTTKQTPTKVFKDSEYFIPNENVDYNVISLILQVGYTLGRK